MQELGKFYFVCQFVYFQWLCNIGKNAVKRDTGVSLLQIAQILLQANVSIFFIRMKNIF